MHDQKSPAYLLDIPDRCLRHRTNGKTTPLSDIETYVMAHLVHMGNRNNLKKSAETMRLHYEQLCTTLDDLHSRTLAFLNPENSARPFYAQNPIFGLSGTADLVAFAPGSTITQAYGLYQAFAGTPYRKTVPADFRPKSSLQQPYMRATTPTHILEKSMFCVVRLADGRTTFLEPHAVQALESIAKNPDADAKEQAFHAGMTVSDFHTSFLRANHLLNLNRDQLLQTDMYRLRMAAPGEVAAMDLKKPEWAIYELDDAYRYAVSVETGEVEALDDDRHLEAPHIPAWPYRTAIRLLRAQHAFSHVQAYYLHNPGQLTRLKDKFAVHATHRPFIHASTLPSFGRHDHYLSIAIVDHTRTTKARSQAAPARRVA